MKDAYKDIYRLYSSLPGLEKNKTCAEIDLAALRHNYRYLQQQFLSVGARPRPIAVVKADAYGHGAPECVRALLAEGCDFFAVSCIDEAVAVRQACNEEGRRAEILILGYTDPALAPLLAQYDLLQTLISPEYARRLNGAAALVPVTLRVHAAVDTGMHRVGFSACGEEELPQAVEELAQACRLSHLRTEGIFTHFSRADEAPDGEGDVFTETQFRRFLSLCDSLEQRGLPRLFRHACNSAAAVRFPQFHLDGVRLGILLFGARPSPALRLPLLRPVMRLKTVISRIHALAPGETVGYGGGFCARDARRIATLPIGYADGILRSFGGGRVTVQTREGAFSAPVVGRICMDQCMVDVTELPAEPGDEVTLFGGSPEELFEYAARASTIDYECLCLISSRVPRRYADGTEEQARNA